MELTKTIVIPSSWLGDQDLDQEELYLALQLGLAQLRQQQTIKGNVVRALLRTGRIRHLAKELVDEKDHLGARQEPLELPGSPVSEVLIAQRRGEL